MVWPIQNTRGKSITVIGAIDRNAGLRHFKIIRESNNTVEFLDFVKVLCGKLDSEDAVLVWDNLAIHKTKIVLEYINR